MKGLPAAVDLSPLVGRELENVSIAHWQANLDFADRVRIHVECDLVVSTPGSRTKRIREYHKQAQPLCDLLGQTVLNAERTDSGGLALLFANGTRLDIENSNERYESFQLHIADTIVVA